MTAADRHLGKKSYVKLMGVNSRGEAIFWQRRL